MPRRGYRKGLSDAKIAAPRRLHTRLPEAVHRALLTEARSRSMTGSDLMRALVTAHTTQTRVQLPQPRATFAAGLRELCRLGNNLNQIAHRAHQMKLHLLEAEARACIAAINATVAYLKA